MSSGKRKICVVDGCETLQQSPSGVCWKCRTSEKYMEVTLKECLTPGCLVQTSSSTGYCTQDGCRQQRGRKVSTEGKAARGQTPDSGSTPDASTDNEFLAMQDDLADLQEENKELKQQLSQLRSEFEQWKIAALPVPYVAPAWDQTYPYQVTGSWIIGS